MKPRAVDELGVLVAGPRLTQRSVEVLKQRANDHRCAPAVLVDALLESAGWFGEAVAFDETVAGRRC